MEMVNYNMHESWKVALKDEFAKAYFHKIKESLKKDKEAKIKVYPPDKYIYNAYNKTGLDQVKIVILGQDPYHNPEQAMGLSFSVPKGAKVPPSLKNIYKEMNNDIDFQVPSHGDLSSWAEQEVLLLNAILTVRHKSPGSHRKIGWEEFTDATIKVISEQKENIVFMLWGNFAKSKTSLIDNKKHLVLEAAHPSPLARGAYFGSKHFSKANAYLKKHGIGAIDWALREEDLFSGC